MTTNETPAGKSATARTRHRTSSRSRQQPVDHRGEEQQVEVDDDARELVALWRVMPAALARDSAGLLTGDRHSKGAASGSAATVNVRVVDAAALIETGLYDVAAQAVRMLNLERDILADPARIIAALPDWHRSLTGRDQPLAKHIRADLRSWVQQARGAIGTRRTDEQLGALCPDHRAEVPTPLRVAGSIAKLADSLIAGPVGAPAPWLGPTCATCVHFTCVAIRERRLIHAGRLTDWIIDVAGQPRWLSLIGEPPFTWQHSKVIRCPTCRSKWESVAEKRMLALMLRELGDQVDLEALSA